MILHLCRDCRLLKSIRLMIWSLGLKHRRSIVCSLCCQARAAVLRELPSTLQHLEGRGVKFAVDQVLSHSISLTSHFACYWILTYQLASSLFMPGYVASNLTWTCRIASCLSVSYRWLLEKTGSQCSSDWLILKKEASIITFRIALGLMGEMFWCILPACRVLGLVNSLHTEDNAGLVNLQEKKILPWNGLFRFIFKSCVTDYMFLPPG